MSAIVRLPTAATSYYRVRRSGKAWAVELVTPGPGKLIASVLARSPSREAAIEYAKAVGAKLQRPVRLPRGVA